MPVEITVKGILSDMDGTLCDSTPAVEGALGAWCLTQGIKPEDFFAVSHGVRTQDNIKRFATVPKLGSLMTPEEIQVEVERLEDEIAATGAKLHEEGKGGILMLPGVGKLLDSLREGGARWAIVTSATKKYALAAQTVSGIIPPPPPILITAESCVHGKPHPEPYLNGLAALNATTPPEGKDATPLLASDILVLEDAPSGLASGLAAGCKTLAVCTGQTRERIRATEATYKVVDLERVEVMKCSWEGITLRLRTLEEEEEEEAKEKGTEKVKEPEVEETKKRPAAETVEEVVEQTKKRRKTLENGDKKAEEETKEEVTNGKQEEPENKEA